MSETEKSLVLTMISWRRLGGKIVLQYHSPRRSNTKSGRNVELSHTYTLLSNRPPRVKFATMLAIWWSADDKRQNLINFKTRVVPWKVIQKVEFCFNIRLTRESYSFFRTSVRGRRTIKNAVHGKITLPLADLIKLDAKWPIFFDHQKNSTRVNFELFLDFQILLHHDLARAY